MLEEELVSSLSSIEPHLRRMTLLLLIFFGALAARGQGPAPETAPPLFPGGALISYNSIFTTRGLMSESSETIQATARPTFSHEGDFNFTWGFHPNFDLTVLVPVVTNHFAVPGGTLLADGTGLGDMLLLVKYRSIGAIRSGERRKRR